MKRLVMILIFIILLSSPVLAISLKDALQSYNIWFTGKAVQNLATCSDLSNVPIGSLGIGNNRFLCDDSSGVPQKLECYGGNSNPIVGVVKHGWTCQRWGWYCGSIIGSSQGGFCCNGIIQSTACEAALTPLITPIQPNNPTTPTTVVQSDANTRPVVLSGVYINDNCQNGGVLTLKCDVQDAETNIANLEVRLWAGQCDAQNCVATRSRPGAPGKGLVYSNGWAQSGRMTYISGSTYDKTVTINQGIGTGIAATCAVFDGNLWSYNAPVNELGRWGDAYPLCIVEQGKILPDLLVTNAETIPEKIRVGNEFDVSFKIKNTGNFVAELEDYVFESYIDAIDFGSRFYPITYDRPESFILLPDEEISYNVTFASLNEVGNYNINVIVDPNNELEESNEENNVFSKQFIVTKFLLSDYPEPFLDFIKGDTSYAIVLSNIADKNEKAAATKIKNSFDRLGFKSENLILSEKDYLRDEYYHQDKNLIFIGNTCNYGELLKRLLWELDLNSCNELLAYNDQTSVKLFYLKTNQIYALFLSSENTRSALKASYVLENYKENIENGKLSGSESLLDTSAITLSCYSNLPLNTCLEKKPSYCDEFGNVVDNCFLCTCGTGRCLASGACTEEVSGLFISTAKLQYYKGEIIKLTSPDYLFDESIGSVSNEFSINSIPGFYRSNDNLKSYYNLLKAKTNSQETTPNKGYIVEFKKQPVLNRVASIRKEAQENADFVNQRSSYNPRSLLKKAFSTLPEDINSEIASHKKEIEREHFDLKNELGLNINNEITGRATADLNSNFRVLGEFDSVFNGMALDITEQQAEAISRNNNVKAVYPNYLVYISKEDQQSQATVNKPSENVNADTVWTLKDNNGFDLTGKEITVAVIDTGIDYTHADLGSCNVIDINGTIEPYSLESAHPYGNNLDFTYIIRKPGFDNIAIHFSRLDVESGWDKLIVADANNNVLQSYSGSYEDVWSPSAQGDTIKIILNSDSVIAEWGFAIDKVLNGVSQIDWNNCEKVVDGFDFVSGGLDPRDDNGHGTHVAGIIAANGVIKGVAPDAKLIAYKVLDKYGSGWNDDIIEAIETAADPNNDYDYSDHFDIISLSLGGAGNPNDPLSQAIDNVVKAGVVAVVAAGNNGPNLETVSSPGTALGAITVGASCLLNQIYTDNNCLSNTPYVALFSSRGPSFVNDKPDLLAPGVETCSSLASAFKNSLASQEEFDEFMRERSCIDSNHIRFSGTSMATPHVSGAIALIKQAHPDWTPEQIKSVLKITANKYGYKHEIEGTGNINILSSVLFEDTLTKSQLEEGLTEIDFRE